MAWKPIVGLRFTVEEFRAYLGKIKFKDWYPQFIVLHNTAAPRLDQWHSVAGGIRMRNLEEYYKNTCRWSAGPHLFVADDYIWVFTPLTTSGTHSPSWNRLSWGVEMVGDYDSEAFDSGPGAKVRANAVAAIAALCMKAGLDSHTLRLHKEDPKTTHACPGKHVDKADFIQRVHDQIVAWSK